MQQEGRDAGKKERQEYSASVEEETGRKTRRDTPVDSWRNGGGQKLTAKQQEENRGKKKGKHKGLKDESGRRKDSRSESEAAGRRRESDCRRETAGRQRDRKEKAEELESEEEVRYFWWAVDASFRKEELQISSSSSSSHHLYSHVSNCGRSDQSSDSL